MKDKGDIPNYLQPIKRVSNQNLKLVGKLKPVKALIPRWVSRIIFKH